MIAQGDFQKMLMSDTKQRIDILRKIFRTERYEQLKNRLQDESKDKKREYDNSKDRMIHLEEDIIETIPENDPGFSNEVGKIREDRLLPDHMPMPEDLTSLLERTLERGNEQKIKLAAESEKLEKEINEHKDLLDKGRRRNEKLKNLSEVCSRIEALKVSLNKMDSEFEEARSHEPESKENDEKAAKLEHILPQYEKLGNDAAEIDRKKNEIKKLETDRSEAEKTFKELNDQLKAEKEESTGLSDAELKKAELETSLKHLSENRDDLSSLLNEQKKLLELEKTLSDAENKLSAAENAKNAAESACSETEKRIEELLRENEELSGYKAEKEKLKADTDILKGKRDAVSKTMTDIENAISAAEKLRKADEELSAARKQKEKAEAAVELINTRTTDLRNELETLRGYKVLKEKILNRQKETDDRLKTLNNFEMDLCEFGKLLSSSKSAQDAYLQAEKNYYAVHSEYESAKHTYLANQAGVLARSLEAGHPCPVCGSLSHPSPAKCSETPLTEEQLNELEQNHNRMNEKRESCSADAKSLRDRAEAKEKELSVSSSELLGCPLSNAENRLAEERDNLKAEQNKLTAELNAANEKLRRSEEISAQLESLGIRQENEARILEDARNNIHEKERIFGEAKGSYDNQIRIAEESVKTNLGDIELENAAECCNERMREAEIEAKMLEEREAENIAKRNKSEKNLRITDELKERLQVQKNDFETKKAELEKAKTNVYTQRGIVRQQKESFIERLQKRFEGCTREQAYDVISAEIRKTETQLDVVHKNIATEDRRINRSNELKRIIPDTEKAAAEKESILHETENHLTGKRSSLEQQEKAYKEAAGALPFPDKGSAEAEILRLRTAAKKIREKIADAKNEKDKTELDISVKRGEETSLRQDISALPEVDTEEREKLLTASNKRKTEISDSLESLNLQINNLERLKKEIAKESQKLRSSEKEYGIIQRLYQTVSGNIPGNRISLETYVLTKNFDKVIINANDRLRNMTDGQYQLERRSQSKGGKAADGLELDVLDLWNGTKRNVQTLSGGESFMASLALALGLSDEIQSVTGGIRLDSMFIDEGFGSLDDKALRKAMNSLRELSEGERLVGIISHVSELKQMTEKQIVVKKDVNGCSKVSLII